jgi:hypothetical protein
MTRPDVITGPGQLPRAHLRWTIFRSAGHAGSIPVARSAFSPNGAMIWPNWLLGLVPPIAGLCGQFARDRKEFPVIGPYFTMAAAIASTILGSIYNVQTGQSAETVAAGIVANVSNVIAPFATEELTDATEGGSLIVKLLIGYFCNLGAAGLMGAALNA